MTIRRVLVFLGIAMAMLGAQSLRITNVQIIDGTGSKPYRGEVRVAGDRIAAAGTKLAAEKGETKVDGKGLALAPGFIDMHSHADYGIFEKPHDAVIRQGITTVLTGQDGFSVYPIKDFFAKLEKQPAAMNVASMAGHAVLRMQVMGKDLYRAATQDEVAQIHLLLHHEMVAGAMGLSTGLEYEPAHFATLDELNELSRMVAGHKGFYISHVRDEGNAVFDSFAELLAIGRTNKIPVEISHIKLGTVPVWHLAAQRMPALFAQAAREGIDLKADVYPYTAWHSTLKVIVLDRDHFNPEKVRKAIAENGGAERLRITRYVPDPKLEGKSLAEIAAVWQTDAVAAYMRIVKETSEPRDGAAIDAEVMGESMSEDDMQWFAAHPRIMFCTDGQLEGSHPRGAGAFPRILGRLVREQKVLTLPEAIRKMTSLPAEQLGLKDRGRIAVGMKADLVLFNPQTVIDRSTVEKPLAPPEGIPAVMVNGQWVVKDGQVTGARPGAVLRNPRQ